VKRSGRDEPVGVVMHKCVETTKGIYLYKYLYLKLAKTPCFSYYLYAFSFKKLAKKRAELGGCK
jgi:hypothetical protein